MFKAIHDIVPEAALGQVSIDRVQGDGVVLPNRTFSRLWIDGVVQMSDLPTEHDSNREFCERAHGDVLIAGLGLGLVLTWILDKRDVLSVLVVEKSAEVIALIAPHYKHPKLQVVQGDIFEWEPDRQFDVIWNDISLEALDALETIREKQTSWLKPNGWLERWYA